MPNPFLVVTALGLAVGLAACDQGAQEQAQTPNREQEQQQQETAPATPPPAEQQQSPASPGGESGGSGSGQQ